MSAVINYHLLEQAYEMPEEWMRYFDRQTGAVVTIDDETARVAQRKFDGTDEDVDDEFDDDEFSGASSWVSSPEALESALEILRDTKDERFIEVPSHWDFHEYREMEFFVEGLANDQVRERLWRAIKRKGAFRRFKDEAFRLNVLEDWYAHRDKALRKFLTDWAESYDLEVDFTQPEQWRKNAGEAGAD